MKYKVKVSYRVWDIYDVEADNEQEAKEQAERRAEGESLNEFNNEGPECTILNN